MAASPSAEPASSSVLAWENPNAPAWAAQDRDPLEDLAAAVAALEDEEDEEDEEEQEEEKKAVRRTRALVMWGGTWTRTGLRLGAG